jgi:hypothetical protein
MYQTRPKKSLVFGTDLPSALYYTFTSLNKMKTWDWEAVHTSNVRENKQRLYKQAASSNIFKIAYTQYLFMKVLTLFLTRVKKFQDFGYISL